MRFRVLIILLFILSVFAVIVVTDKDKSQKKIEDIRINLLNGQQMKLSDYAGRPIFLHFWATWCTPCVEEFPRLLSLAKANPEWQFILISADEKPEAIAPFLNTMEVKAGIPLQSLPNLVSGGDEDKRISQQMFQTVSYPETVLIDRKMRLRKKIIGTLPEGLNLESFE